MTVSLSAEYIAGGAGPWLLTRWQAPQAHAALLLLPPFAEEMNCCRRVFAQLCQRLAQQGIDCYLPDFYGSGDSGGDFSEVSLPQWRDDLLAWLPQLAAYPQVHLLGCRFGAALLLDWLAQLQQQLHTGKILLWQPLLQPQRFWQQLQRQQQLGGGQPDTSATLDVAGYQIPLQVQAQSMALNTGLPADLRSLCWLESSLTGLPAPASQKLQQAYPDLMLTTVSGMPYWLSQEPVDTSALLDASWGFIQSNPAPGVADKTTTQPRIQAAIRPPSADPRIIPLQLLGQTSLGIYQPAASDLLVVMVNGGAQTRTGSHRMQQQLALHWQQAGVASLRFDFPGFGDASGPAGHFVDHARALTELPAQLADYFGRSRPLVLFGLCDGATAALLASPWLQPQALILLNPWCRTTANHARTMLKFYYVQRLLSAEFWRKLLRGQWQAKASLAALCGFLRRQPERGVTTAVPLHAEQQLVQLSPDAAIPLALQHWQQLACPVQLVLSGADLTAAECRQMLQQPDWQQLWQSADLVEIAQANHTLTQPHHLAQLMTASSQFLTTLPPAAAH